MGRIEHPEHQAKPLIVIAAMDDRDAAGLIAKTQFARLRISIFDTAILVAPEGSAVERDCKYAHVDTMGYQHPTFYLEQCYTIASSLPDWDSPGRAKIHLTKRLTPAA